MQQSVSCPWLYAFMSGTKPKVNVPFQRLCMYDNMHLHRQEPNTLNAVSRNLTVYSSVPVAAIFSFAFKGGIWPVAIKLTNNTFQPCHFNNTIYITGLHLSPTFVLPWNFRSHCLDPTEPHPSCLSMARSLTHLYRDSQKIEWLGCGQITLKL